MRVLYECYKCKSLSEERPEYCLVYHWSSSERTIVVADAPLCKRCIAVAVTPIKPRVGFSAV